MNAFDRRDHLVAHLDSIGVSGAAADFICSITAPGRHAARVARAKECALEWALKVFQLERDDCTSLHNVWCGAVLWSDVVGIGGALPGDGDGTARHPANAGCGKGRKHATDGGAWSAAIHEAARSCRGSFTITNGVIVYASDHGTGETTLDGLLPIEWQLSIAAVLLRRKADPSAFIDCPINVGDVPMSDIATVYNALAASVPTSETQKIRY